MKITNEREALTALRHAAAAMDAPSKTLSYTFFNTIPEVAKFIGGETETVLFVDKEYCWFFGADLAIRSTIRAFDDPIELTCYIPARDFGPITIIKQGAGTLSVIIARDSTGSIELQATGENVKALETALRFLLGHGGPARG